MSESDERVRRMAAKVGHNGAFGVLGGPEGRFNLWRRKLLSLLLSQKSHVLLISWGKNEGSYLEHDA